MGKEKRKYYFKALDPFAPVPLKIKDGESCEVVPNVFRRIGETDRPKIRFKDGQEWYVPPYCIKVDYNLKFK